jgi:hypothetical protein
MRGVKMIVRKAVNHPLKKMRISMAQKTPKRKKN